MEEELRVVGNNLKSLELSEEKALEREDTCNAHIRELSARLKEVQENNKWHQRNIDRGFNIVM